MTDDAKISPPNAPNVNALDNLDPAEHNLRIPAETPYRPVLSPYKILDVGIVLIPFLGGLTLILVAVAYETFYDAFNVKPAEVGLDSVKVLNRAYASLLLYSALLGIMIALGASVWRWVRRKPPGAPGGTPRIGLPFVAAYTIWFFAFMFQLQAPEFDRDRIDAYMKDGLGHDVMLALSDWFLFLATLFAIVASSILIWIKGRYRGTTAVTMSALSLFFGLVILMASAYKTGLYTAFELLDQGPRANIASGPALTWFSVPAPCVDVIWFGSEPAPTSLPTQDVIYMGEANGTALLIDGQTGYITRLPSGQLLLQEKSPTACPGRSRPAVSRDEESTGME